MIVGKITTHDQLFPDEAFDRDLEGHIDPRRVEEAEYEQFVTELKAAARIAVGDDVNSKGYLKKEVEQKLMSDIQRGHSAENEAKELGDVYDGRWNSEIEQGLAARHRLFIAHAPFAIYMARKSVDGVAGVRGRIENRVPAVQRKRGEYLGQLATAGAYARIANLGSPTKSLADRTQDALEGLWIATGKCKPASGTIGSARTAAFTTYAAYHIHNQLSLARTTEPSGWYMAPHTYRQYTDALNDISLYGRAAPISHVSSSGGLHQGLPPVQALAGRDSIGLNEVASINAPEEEDVFGDPEALSLDEITPTPGSEPAGAIVESADMRSKLLEVVGQLDEREAGIILHRFGFDGAPKTLDEIAKIYGVRRERIRQLELRAMAKLRAPKNIKALTGLLGDDAAMIPSTYLEAIADGTGHVRTTPTRLLPRSDVPIPSVDVPPSIQPLPRTDPSWQADPRDQWGDTVRRGATSAYPPGI